MIKRANYHKLIKMINNNKQIIGDWLPFAIDALKNANISNPRLDAQLLLCHHINMDRSYIIAFPEHIIDNIDRLNEILHRRMAREPLSHIIGKREFWSMDFIVNNKVLDPRADSETLIEAILSRVIDKNAKINIIDFGTGSGCLLMALLHELPNATGIGVDISQDALVIAKLNAKNLGFINRCSFIQTNWEDYGDRISQKVDIIISNPPYIKFDEIDNLQIEVKKFEPHIALDGGKDGFKNYPIIAELAFEILNDGGIFGFEFGQNQGNKIEKILYANKFLNIIAYNDLNGITRCLTAIK